MLRKLFISLIGLSLVSIMAGVVVAGDDSEKKMHKKFMMEAIKEARKSLQEGRIPEGSILVKDGQIIGRGRNKQEQKDLLSINSEMDCMGNAGGLTDEDYRKCTLYTTLSPCDEASDVIVARKIPVVVIGENETFEGPERYLKDRGVKLIDLDMKECKNMMKDFRKNRSETWDED